MKFKKKIFSLDKVNETNSFVWLLLSFCASTFILWWATITRNRSSQLELCCVFLTTRRDETSTDRVVVFFSEMFGCRVFVVFVVFVFVFLYRQWPLWNRKLSTSFTFILSPPALWLWERLARKRNEKPKETARRVAACSLDDRLQSSGSRRGGVEPIFLSFFLSWLLSWFLDFMTLFLDTLTLLDSTRRLLLAVTL